jgi:DNA replication protein DnaC
MNEASGTLTQPQAADATRDLRLQLPKLRAIDPEKMARLAREEQERAASQQAEMTIARRRGAGIPLRLSRNIEESLQTPTGKPWRQKLDKLSSEIGTGFLYSLIGTYGTGKSQLGTALAWKACATTTALFIHAPELFDTIKDVFRGDDGDTVRQQLQRFITPKLLVIDEVNQGLTPADIRYLHRVICQRYDDMTDTLLISNETKPNFQTLVGDRVVSRMIECGGIIEANWPSFRT